MAYQLTSKITGKTSVITDEQYQNALSLPGFSSRFKAEPILPPAKIVRKKVESDVTEAEGPDSEQSESDASE